MNDTIEINVTINGETTTKTISIGEWTEQRDAQFGESPCDNIVEDILWLEPYYRTNYFENKEI